MSSIQSLGISGVRGYTPQNYQKIEFMKPLTLIWGKNGSGKTTIIECLKYITTGSLPPNSDKGKSFIMDNKIAGKPEVIGDIRLIFRTGNRAILAKRRIQLSAKGNSTKFQSIQQLLKTRGQNGEQLTINHQCAEIQKQVPQFLGISKPILQNIVFCHQDESLWPFGDSTLLKSIFDQLFQTKKLTKQMQKTWQVHKQQQTQLKQLKIRLQYQKQTFRRQLEQRGKLMNQLEQLNLKSKQLSLIKSQLKQLQSQVKDNKQKVKQRQDLIYRKGVLQNSILNIQQKCFKCKQKLYNAKKTLQQKMKGAKVLSKSIAMQEQDYSYSNAAEFSKNFGYGNYNNNNSMSFGFGSYGNVALRQQIEKIEIQRIDEFQKVIEILEEKKQVHKQLIKKLQASKQMLDNIRMYNESSKRQKEIKSQIDRIKSILPELKYGPAKNVTKMNDQEFLKLVKTKIVEIEDVMKSRQICKKKLEGLEIPNFINNGVDQKEIETFKKQAKELQAEIQTYSITILKIYQHQYKKIPDGIDSSEQFQKQGQRCQLQFKNLQAIILSKQDQLKHYKQMPQQENKVNIQQQINHYKYAGIELQQNMLHFCEEKKKCYFCMREMKKEEIDAARQKVTSIKAKTNQRIEELEKKRASQTVNQTISPQIMVKKLSQQIDSLKQKAMVLEKRLTKYNESRIHRTQYLLNITLVKQLKKCGLTIQMLPKLSSVKQTEPKPQQYYKNIKLEEFVDMCTNYQVKTARYKGLKQQVTIYETNQQRNQLIKQKRQTMIQQRQSLIQALEKAESEVKNYDFLKNSCQKLQTLIKMETKSKNKKNNSSNNKNAAKQSSQSSDKFSTIQQAQHAINNLYLQIFQICFQIEKIQITLTYNKQLKTLQIQKQNYQKLISSLNKLTHQLTTCQSILDKYNEKNHFFQKQSQKIKQRIQIISHALNQPFEAHYLLTLNKIKHLQASIQNLELIYRYMQQSISEYHAQKMEEINRYIYEIWRQIYHGEDIQYIEIEASAEKDSKKKKKNYQYRILMKKSTKGFKNQELVEMKGRCSMGQRVLASIVIRLSLAEVFSTSSRILALDQPTTNLDRQHIKNLSISLLRLIQISGGKNLQLIIISHDMQFIKMLQQYADSYYEVSRDEHKFSKITKKSIKEMFAKQMMMMQ